MRPAAAILLFALPLAACHRGADQVADGVQLRDGTAVLQVPDHPDATIDGRGQLHLGERDLALSRYQQDLIRQYYVALYKLRSARLSGDERVACHAQDAAAARQRALADSLPAFRPYANIRDDACPSHDDSRAVARSE